MTQPRGLSQFLTNNAKLWCLDVLHRCELSALMSDYDQLWRLRYQYSRYSESIKSNNLTNWFTVPCCQYHRKNKPGWSISITSACLSSLVCFFSWYTDAWKSFFSPADWLIRVQVIRASCLRVCPLVCVYVYPCMRACMCLRLLQSFCDSYATRLGCYS